MIKVIKILSSLFLRIFYRIELVDIENVPKRGAGILCANHISDLDMFFIGFKLSRLIRYMAKEEIFKYPILSQLAGYCGAFPVKRGVF